MVVEAQIILSNMEKLFNIVFKGLSDSETILLLEEYLKVDLMELDEVWNEFRHEFQVYRSNRIKSSNVKFVNYDSNTQTMTIQFNNNATYEYYKVPMMLYLQVRNGLAVCKTTGRNAYGEWYKGKFPSAGAAVWRYLRDKGIDYKRVK
jgi:hypothetical protein